MPDDRGRQDEGGEATDSLVLPQHVNRRIGRLPELT
jgi:hypothetical protein